MMACQSIRFFAWQSSHSSIPATACLSQPSSEQVLAGSDGPTKVGNGALGCGAGLSAEGVAVGVADGSEAAAAEAVAGALGVRRGGGGRVGAGFLGAGFLGADGSPGAAGAGVVEEGAADDPGVLLGGGGLVGAGLGGAGLGGAGSLDEANEESEGSCIDGEASGF
jgi:hypothetical protein